MKPSYWLHAIVLTSLLVLHVNGAQAIDTSRDVLAEFDSRLTIEHRLTALQPMKAPTD